MSAIITAANMDQMIAAYGSEYLIDLGLIIPVQCDMCGGTAEEVFNRDPRRDPINDEVRPCEHCGGLGSRLEIVAPVGENAH
jgi:NAD-dependent SIR2 family protein deacetylase